jgi:hypothetical protein
MSPGENTAILLIRLDQLTAEVAGCERLLLDQAARLCQVRREIAVARMAAAEMAVSEKTNNETRKRRTA